MSKKEAIEKIAGLLGDDMLNMSTTNNEGDLTRDNIVSSKDNSSAKGKITLEEFFARTDKVLLNIPTQEEFSALVKIFKDLGITTNSGREFKEGMWQKYEHLTIISPDRKIGAGVESAKYYGYEVINFKDLDLEKYLSQEELTKLGIEISPKEVEEVVESVDDLGSSNDNRLLPNQYKITIDKFWGPQNKNKKLAIHCDEEWKANILMKVFDRMGKTWLTGRKYTQNNNFDMYKSDTCYSCLGAYSDISTFEKYTYVIYPFDQVDLSKYLTQEQVEEIKNKLGFDPLQNNQFVQTQGVQSSVTQNNQGNNTQKQNVQNSQNAQSQKVSTPSVSYDITADEFWQAGANGKKLVINCDEEWKAKVLIEVFKRMFVYNPEQARDFYENYKSYGSRTCYSNDRTFSPKEWFEGNGVPVYPFEKVDLSKYLTQKDVNTIISMSGIWRKYLRTEDIKEMLDSLGLGYLFTDDMTLQ